MAPTLVLLDLYLPDGHGLDLVRETLPRKDHQRPDFLVITAARGMASVRAAMQLGTVHYVVKPFSFAQLEERLNAYRDMRGRLKRIDGRAARRRHPLRTPARSGAVAQGPIRTDHDPRPRASPSLT